MASYDLFGKRADQDPEARTLTGWRKIAAGWRLLLRDDKKLLGGRAARQEWRKDRNDLLS